MAVNNERNIIRGWCSLKAEAEEGSPIMNNHSTAVMRSRGASPLSDSMMSEEAGDEVLINDITHEIPCDSNEENALTTDMYGADLQRTLGEILAYCQVTYGAILKLDEKFEILQAKVASIQTLHQNTALISQRTHVSSSYTDNCQPKTEGSLTPDAASSMPHLVHSSSSSPLSSVESRKPPTLSPGPEVPSPPRLVIQNQCHSSAKATATTRNSTQGPSFSTNKMTLMQQLKERVKSQAQTSSSASSADPANIRCLGNSERKVFLSNCVLQRAGKMARPSAAVRYLLRNIFTTEELSQSSTTGNPVRCLKRLDPNKINAIREWAVKRYPKYDLREKGKDWKVCLSVMNSTSRYFRFMDKTRMLKMKDKEQVPSEAATTTVTCEPTAEIDVELSDSDSDQKQQETLKSRMKTVSDCNIPTDSKFTNSIPIVYLGPPHRDVKVPEFALSAAHLRTRPELIARYLIKFLFPEDVLLRSNVYGGARHGIQPLDRNRISALREHLLERFPWMSLEEGGCDWKICVEAINSTIRKFRYEHKMRIKKEKCQR
ncbi:BEN domain-containing protein 2 isoform X2 [Myxocyprinus asiaticus]|uniref:BEN domain-containing protein 2 isoform X2 n=1 Tax=Myxocyprinus asiaticus TaxID=70543 RepID=UPI0022239BE4|nr:BEN domain-containing protein 2 isoform X2 [Myxocyprinus asiaticus]